MSNRPAEIVDAADDSGDFTELLLALDYPPAEWTLADQVELTRLTLSLVLQGRGNSSLLARMMRRSSRAP